MSKSNNMIHKPIFVFTENEVKLGLEIGTIKEVDGELMGYGGKIIVTKGMNRQEVQE